MMPNGQIKQRKNSGWNALQSARLDNFYILKYFGWAFLALRFDIWNFLVFPSLERLRSQRKHRSCSSGLANSSRTPSSFLSALNTPAVALASSWDANVPFGLLLSFQTDRNKDLDGDVSRRASSSMCLTFACYSPSVRWIRTLWLLVTPVKWLSHTTYHLEKGIDKL